VSPFSILDIHCAIIIMGGTSSVLSGTEGYHVLAVEVDSPADLAGLEPYFDFIVGVDNIDLVSPSSLQL
jgi:hydrogenase maturation factor